MNGGASSTGFPEGETKVSGRGAVFVKQWRDARLRRPRGPRGATFGEEGGVLGRVF